MKSSTTLIYDVTIEPAGDCFRITWQGAEKNRPYTFTNDLQDSVKGILTKWEDQQHQVAIGQALFNFLDGKEQYFQQVLDKADKLDETLQINLRTCKETADWPFELLAGNGEFLLFRSLHLVRRVSDRGILKKVFPQNRLLRLLFMASSPRGLDGELNYVREEEAMLRITEKLPIEVEIEDSGSLGGLQRRLVQKYYDIVHLSGHANIDGKGKPFLYMEDEAGKISRVYPGNLRDGALIENSPRLLFLSGCRTGETGNEAEKESAISFARQMVEDYYIPAVLGWGRSVWDLQANLAGKTIYNELSRGRTIPEAAQRARYEMQRKFPGHAEPAWPMLRLYCDGMPLTALVKKEQPQEPKPLQITYVYLAHSRMKVLKEGFVGRRLQLQTSMQTLNSDTDKAGVLLLGTGGLGKSCLAGKIAERFNKHTLIIVQGKLNTTTMESALKEAFIASQDNNGKRILSQNITMADKLADLCATSFKEKNYLLILDGFQRNQEDIKDGQPGLLMPEAEKLMDTLLYYLPYCGKMTHLVITSRYSFTLSRQDRDLVRERLQKVWLTSFEDIEQLRHTHNLKNIHRQEDAFLWEQLIKAGSGNPLLMEKLDRLAGQIPANETVRLQEEIEKIRENFIRELGLYELYRQCSEPLRRILECLSIYPDPLAEDHIRQYETSITGLPQWKELLGQGMNLGLVEHDQVNLTYNLTPLLKKELKREFEADKQN